MAKLTPTYSRQGRSVIPTVIRLLNCTGISCIGKTLNDKTGSYQLALKICFMKLSQYISVMWLHQQWFSNIYIIILYRWIHIIWCLLIRRDEFVFPFASMAGVLHIQCHRSHLWLLADAAVHHIIKSHWNLMGSCAVIWAFPQPVLCVRLIVCKVLC